MLSLGRDVCLDPSEPLESDSENVTNNVSGLGDRVKIVIIWKGLSLMVFGV